MRFCSLKNCVFILAFGLLGLLSLARGFNEDQPYYKWAPEYLYSSRNRISPSASAISTYAGLSAQRPSSFYNNRASFYQGSLGYRNPGFIRSGNAYKRTGCMSAGNVCHFRSGLMGVVMKLPCCEGSTCTLVGSKFMCVDDEELLARAGGLEPETISIDPDDLAGWNRDIFGRKK